MEDNLRIAIFGATGRLGKAIALLALSDPRFQITAALTHPASPHLGLDYGTFLQRSPLHIPIAATEKKDEPQRHREHRESTETNTIEKIVPENNFTTESTEKAVPDLLIDVSLSSGLSTRLALALSLSKPLVIGTTGLSDADFALLHNAAQKIPLFYTPNFSLGMALLHKLAAATARLFHSDAQIDLTETHHTKKKDAPSGSALSLAKTLTTTPRIHSLRSGDTIGIHELCFNAPEEQLTLSHHVHSRDAFARGALAAARFLATQPPGLYDMNNLFSHL